MYFRSFIIEEPEKVFSVSYENMNEMNLDYQNIIISTLLWNLFSERTQGN